MGCHLNWGVSLGMLCLPPLAFQALKAEPPAVNSMESFQRELLLDTVQPPGLLRDLVYRPDVAPAYILHGPYVDNGDVRTIFIPYAIPNHTVTLAPNESTPESTQAYINALCRVAFGARGHRLRHHQRNSRPTDVTTDPQVDGTTDQNLQNDQVETTRP